MNRGREVITTLFANPMSGAKNTFQMVDLLSGSALKVLLFNECLTVLNYRDGGINLYHQKTCQSARGLSCGINFDDGQKSNDLSLSHADD
jgi:hypothetical protein